METMPEVPWLKPEALALASTICADHRRAFGQPLIAAGHPAGAASRLLAQELFAAATVVLAHDAADPGSEPGPRLIYANRAALQLWHRPWAELVGMPSRLTAEPGERAGRARALNQALRQSSITGYSGVRIDSRGRRFQISGARVWTLWHPGKEGRLAPCGQAAAFSTWHWL